MAPETGNALELDNSFDLSCPADFQVEADLLQAFGEWLESGKQTQDGEPTAAVASSPPPPPPPSSSPGVEEPIGEAQSGQPAEQQVAEPTVEPELFEIDEDELLAQLLSEDAPEEEHAAAAAVDQRSADERVEAMMKAETKEYQGCIRSYDDCVEMEAAYLRRQDKSAAFMEGTTSADFPETATGHRMCVEQLFNAMRNTESILDCGRWVPKKGPDGKVLKVDGKPTSERVLEPAAVVERVERLRGVEVELLAWKLLMATRDAQLGRLGVGNWTTEISYQKFSCWRDRFDSVVTACKESKAIVMDLTDHQWILRVARSPVAETKKKVSNRQLNVKRHGESMRGRRAAEDRELIEVLPPVENPALEAAAARLRGTKRGREGGAGETEAGSNKRQRRAVPAMPTLPSPSPSPPSTQAPQTQALAQLRAHIQQRGEMTYEQIRAQCAQPRMV